VFVNNSFRTSKFVNSTTITVAMTSTDLATPGAQQIFVENFPPRRLRRYGALPFVVASAPIVTPRRRLSASVRNWSTLPARTKRSRLKK